MTGKMSGKTRFVRCPKCLNVLPEPADVPVYKCGGCGATLQAKKRNNSTVNTTPQRLDDDDSLGKRKVDQVFGDPEAGSSSSQQLLLKSADESDLNSDHDAVNKAKNDAVDALSRRVKEHSYGKQKMKQLCDDHEASSSSNQQSLVNNTIHNDPRSSTELSGHEDPESSPEAAGHTRINQDQEQNQENTTIEATSIDTQKINHLSDDDETYNSFNQQLMANSIKDLPQNDDHNEEPESSPEETVNNRIDQDYGDDHDQFLSCRRDVDFEESSSEFEEAYANTRNIRDSRGGSKSNFKSLIAEKLLDPKRKKAVHLDKDDMLSEDGSTDLHHRGRFHRIGTIESTETGRFGGTSYYDSQGSVSSFEGNENRIRRKYRFGSIGDDNVDSGNGYHFNQRNQNHPSNVRLGKHEHRSTEIRSLYGLNEFPVNRKHHSQMISENPKMERIELLKMVRDLQDQLERTKMLSPQQAPVYNNHIFNSPGRYGQRMAFSGETTAVNSRLDASSCHHCFPQDRRFSAQLPHQHVCCNGPRHEPNTYYSPRFSVMSSPIHNHLQSETSALDDYGHRIDITKPVHSPMKKRYVRPIAGAAPWIICYRCSKHLELPQSFLVFNKKYHSLKCGSCFKVLNFTLSNGTHVSQYYPEEMIAAPPSSEAEDYDEFNGSYVEPVSCSDRSFQKSCSTETDRNGSREFSEERRKASMSRDPSGSAQPSSSKTLERRKMTPGNKAEFRPNGSPLHQLMGYASPSKVIRS